MGINRKDSDYRILSFILFCDNFTDHARLYCPRSNADMLPKEVDRMANRVDSDQTAH